MGVTSFEPFYRTAAFHRKSDSDNDSAISLSIDNAAMEKQRTMSVIQMALADRSVQKRWTWKSFTVEPIISILPNFIGQRLRGLPPKTERHGGVPALDGLRGLACLIVFNARLTANYDRSIQFAYTTMEDYKSVLQLPVVRLLWSDSAMIDISFIISGYVLAYKPLRQIHAGNTLHAHRYLTSSTIRRGLRLYLPTLFAVFMTGLLSWLGVFDQARSIYEHQNNIYEFSEALPHHFVSLNEQMKDAGRNVLKLLDIYRQTEVDLRANSYDSYLWSIPANFHNSMTLLLSLCAASHLRTRFRMMTTVTFITFFTYFGNRVAVLFLLGMLIADIDQSRITASRHISYTSYYHEITSSSTSIFSSSLHSSKLLAIISPKSPIYLILFLLGLLICSIPIHDAQINSFYRHPYAIFFPILSSLPADIRIEWFRIPGLAIIVWSAANSTHLRILFVNRFAQYLSKISLSFYLVQGTILRLVLHAYIPMLYHKLGDGTRQGQTQQSIIVTWLLGIAVCLPLTIWVADIFWRAIDQPCVRFTRWLEDYVSDWDDGIGGSSPKRDR